MSFLVIALVYSPSFTFSVPNRSNSGLASCTPIGGSGPTGASLVECCWSESVPPGTGYGGGNSEIYCSECEDGGTRGKINCSDPELQFFEGRTPGLGVLPEDGVLEEPPTPPSGPAAPLQDGGVLQQLPSEGGETQPPTRGQGVLPQDGVLQQQEPTDEGTGATPRTVEPTAEEATQPSTEPLPPCPEGQVLDEETDLCVLEEPEVTEEPEQQPSTEEGDGSEDNNDADNN